MSVELIDPTDTGDLPEWNRKVLLRTPTCFSKGVAAWIGRENDASSIAGSS
jgi:hypothetical protein